MLKEFLKSLNKSSPALKRYVLGNESGDLDSVACALCYAYFLGKKQGYRPILNFPKEDLALRPELCSLIKELNLEDLLIFKTDLVDVQELVLVDHHTLAVDQADLAPFVVEILDHHPGEVPLYPQLQHKEMVSIGSLSSWIAMKLPASEWPLDCARLLYSAILLDTKDGKDPCKTKPDDEKMLQALAHRLNRSDRNADYLVLNALKWELSQEGLLRKDLKSYRSGTQVYGIVSAPSFAKVSHDLAESFRQERGFDALFLFETKSKTLTLITSDSVVFEQFFKGVPFPLLEKKLGMARFQCPEDSARKTIQPMLNFEFFR